MLIKRVIIICTIILSAYSYSSIYCNIGENRESEYNYEISKLKISNKNIYKSYLLADKEKIYISDNENQILPIASLTKMMTAMLVIDSGTKLSDEIEIDKEVSQIPYGARLKNNEKYTVEELLKLMLVSSSNSSAKALSKVVSDDFVALMNKKAKEIGANNTRYCTPHGLPPKYTNTCMDVSTAKDIYIISKYLIENYPYLREIVNKNEIEVHDKKYKNTNNLLSKMEYINGIKTGFHNEAGYNISIYYSKDNKQLFEVILGSDSSNNRSKISELILKKVGEK